jgi:sulfite exporter TauE/SafE
MLEITLIPAFLTGLLGSVHCIGMCGGIVGALTMGLPQQVRTSAWQMLPFLLSYNMGRIGSYIIAGMVVGFIGSQIKPLFSSQIHLWISGLFLIALGLYLSGWWQALVFLEKLATPLWRKLSPLGQKFLPVQTLFHAFVLGIVWGWLPCGLVYTALALALASGGTWQGGLIMLAFGTGTLPMLLTMGTTTHWLTQWTRQPIVRQLMGSVVILFGLYLLFSMSHHEVHKIHGVEMCDF